MTKVNCCDDEPIIVNESEHTFYNSTPITYIIEGNGYVYGRANITWKHLWRMFKCKLMGKIQILVTPYDKPDKFRVEIISIKRNLLRPFDKKLNDEIIEEHDYLRKKYEDDKLYMK